MKRTDKRAAATRKRKVVVTRKRVTQASEVKRQAARQKRKAEGPERRTRAEEFVTRVADPFMHQARVLSLTHLVVGVLNSVSLALHAIGAGMADAYGLAPKHATKQVDRLLANAKLKVWAWFAYWIPFVLGLREEAVVAMDWTEFDEDKHSTICIYLITDHGRATPLLWKTHKKSSLKDHRNEFEDDLILRLRELVPTKVRLTLLADRGFGDHKLYELLQRLGIAYVIRFRGGIQVDDDHGTKQTAKAWLLPNGRARRLENALVTGARFRLPIFIGVQQTAMKDAWYLASSRTDLANQQIISLYGRRFTIEETFRDTKDSRFGLGLSATHIGSPEKRDRLLMVTAIAHVFLTTLGAATEDSGLDRLIKVNTSKRRTLSLFRLGVTAYGLIPNMREDRLVPLIEAFGKRLQEQGLVKATFGVT
jgi:hypothetical protein